MKRNAKVDIVAGGVPYWLSRGIRAGIKPLDTRGKELIEEYFALEEKRSFGFRLTRAELERLDTFRAAARILRKEVKNAN